MTMVKCDGLGKRPGRARLAEDAVGERVPRVAEALRRYAECDRTRVPHPGQLNDQPGSVSQFSFT